MFGFGKHKPKDRDLEALKRQQVEHLKQAVPVARAVNAEETMFDIPIPSASATAVLRVQLPPLFPDHAPALRLMGLNIRHQWVDPGGLVAYHPRLNPWHSQNSLAEIVVQVIQEITKTVGGSPLNGTFFPPQAQQGYPGHPPQLAQTHTNTSTNTSTLSTLSHTDSSSSPPPPTRPPISLPPLPTTLPPPHDKASIEELNKLLSDEVSFSLFLPTLPQVKEANRQLEAIRRTNADIARATLVQQEEYNSVREEVTQLLDVLKTVQKAYEDKLKTHTKASTAADGGLSEVITQLEAEAAASESKSEAIAKAFISGDIKLPEFQSDFLKERKLFHERSAKVEKIHQILGHR